MTGLDHVIDHVRAVVAMSEDVLRIRGHEVSPACVLWEDLRSIDDCKESGLESASCSRPKLITQSMKSIDLAPLRPPEVQRNTFLVTAGEYPAPVKLGLGDAGELRVNTPQVAAARPFYLDHLGAKVRHHGGRRRPRDIGSTIDNPDSGEQTTVIHFSDTSSTILTEQPLIQRIARSNQHAVKRPSALGRGYYAFA